MSTINKLVLGTVQFGCQYGINSAGRPDSASVNEILRKAKQSGIEILDTSSAYGNAEEVLGDNLTHDDTFNIVSKYPRGTVPPKDRFEESLRKLKVDFLYGYLLHHFEVYRNNPSIWNEFLKLRDSGKVAKIGFSLYTPDELELLLNNNVDFALLQIPHNIFDRKFDPYLKELKDKGVEIHVRSTFLQGLFFMDRERLPEKLVPLRTYLDCLDTYSVETGMSISEIALNYNIQNPFFDGVLIGVDNVEQLMANVNAVSERKIKLDIEVKEQELLNPVNWK